MVTAAEPSDPSELTLMIFTGFHSVFGQLLSEGSKVTRFQGFTFRGPAQFVTFS